MPVVEVTGGDVQSGGLLHPVLDVAEPEDQVDGGEEEQDEEAEQGGEHHHRGGEAGQAREAGEAGRGATGGTGSRPRAGGQLVQSPVGGSAQAKLRVGEDLGVRRVVFPSCETPVQSVPVHHDSLQMKTLYFPHQTGWLAGSPS